MSLIHRTGRYSVLEADPTFDHLFQFHDSPARKISSPAHKGLLFPIGALKMLLEWNTQGGFPKSVLLIKSAYDTDPDQIKSSFVPLAQYILQKGKVLYLEPEFLDQLKSLLLCSEINDGSRIVSFSGAKAEQKTIDMVITLGGDGTMLRSVSLFQFDHIPVFLSFRFGTLGFLTPHVWCPNSFRPFIDKAFSGQIPVQLRGRLMGQIWRCDADGNPQLQVSRKVLNEVTIHRGLGSRVDLDVYVNDSFVTTISGDGVLVSTPSGSTAHALSAGASLVHPNIPCIMITPICVHSLSFRPIILPSNSVIKVLPADNSRYYPWVCYDGDGDNSVQLSCVNNVNEVIVIESAGVSDLVPCICSEEPVGDWLADLQERLYWNVSKTANSINPLLQNKLEPCGQQSEQELAKKRPSLKNYMTKSASSICLRDSFKNGFDEQKVLRPQNRTAFVMDNKSYSILDSDHFSYLSSIDPK